MDYVDQGQAHALLIGSDYELVRQYNVSRRTVVHKWHKRETVLDPPTHRRPPGRAR
jgi:hypothetical protein